MILIDTSAWIEFLRDTGSPTCEAVERLLAEDIAICDAVRMEILAGARDSTHLGRLRGLLARAALLETTTRDYENAAAHYRSCRRHGETVRKLMDCLIAAIAIREDLAVLHQDADFDVIARHTGLRIQDPNG